LLSGSGAYQNLELSDSNGATLTGSPTISGTLTLTSGTFSVAANTLTLNGPAIAGAGSQTNLSTTSSSSLVFGGNSGGVFLPTSVLQLASLTENNTLGASPELTLNSSPTINISLVLTSGRISTGTNTLTLVAAATVTGGAAGSHVVGNVARAFDATHLSFAYPIGDGSVYSPVTITFANAAALTAPGNLTTTVTAQDHPDTAMTSSAGRSGIDPAHSANRYWTLKNSTLAGVYSATFTYAATDIDGAGTVQANFKVARGEACVTSGGIRTCNPWGFPAASATNTSGPPPTSQISSLAILNGDFALDFAIGQGATARFVRQKEFIYTREQY
jgi:hypothetical protein